MFKKKTKRKERVRMEIIERCPIESGGIFHCRQQYDGRLQVSYNSDKRLVLRLILDENGRKDVLVCLTEVETKKLVNFIYCIKKGEFKQPSF